MSRAAKNIHTNIRLTQAGMEQLRTICKAQGISQSHFMRCCIKHYLGNNDDKIFERDAQLKKSIHNQVCRRGNNINQIAYNLNYLKNVAKGEIINNYIEIDNDTNETDEKANNEWKKEASPLTPKEWVLKFLYLLNFMKYK